MTREEVLNILEGINADVEEGLGYNHEKWVSEVESICEEDEMKYDDMTDDDVIGFLEEIRAYYASLARYENEQCINWANSCLYAIRRIRAIQKAKKDIDALLDAHKNFNRNEWREGVMTGLAQAYTTIEHYEKEKD